MIEWRKISLAFENRQLFSEWSARVERGERVVLRGRSGVGKSSLFAMVLGFLQPDAGSVIVDGREVADDTVDDIRRTVAWLPQSITLGDGTVRESIRSILRFDANKELDVGDDDITSLLERLRLPSKIVDQPVAELSGGERQRVGFAAVVLLRRSIYLLDEPTSALDDRAASAVRDILADFDPDTTVVVIAHGDRWNSYREIELS